MVFRKDNKSGDSFQRQISALREQLGGSGDGDLEEGEFEQVEEYTESTSYANETYEDPTYREDFATSEGANGSEFEEPEIAGSASVPEIDPSSTVVSRDTVWKGEVESQGSMHVLGRFEGVIKARENVYILNHANVDASISADRVVIGGTYTGTVTCDAHLEVLPTGRLKGEVRSPALVVHDGAVMNGKIQMSGNSQNQSQPAPSLIRKSDVAGSA